MGTDIGAIRKEQLNIPLFNSLCFICKDDDSADDLACYLRNNMNVDLDCKRDHCYSYFTKCNERIDIWTRDDFRKMRASRYQVIFIQEDIYSDELVEESAVHALWINEFIPYMNPLVFRLPKRQNCNDMNE